MWLFGFKNCDNTIIQQRIELKLITSWVEVKKLRMTPKV